MHCTSKRSVEHGRRGATPEAVDTERGDEHEVATKVSGLAGSDQLELAEIVDGLCEPLILCQQQGWAHIMVQRLGGDRLLAGVPPDLGTYEAAVPSCTKVGEKPTVETTSVTPRAVSSVERAETAPDLVRSHTRASTPAGNRL